MIQDNPSTLYALSQYCKDYKAVCKIQKKYIQQFLYELKRYGAFTQQLYDIILSYLFVSPFRIKACFVLMEGSCSLQVPVHNNKYSDGFGLYSAKNDTFMCQTNPMMRYQMVQKKQKYTIKQNDRFLLGNNITYYDNVRISKIWKKPATSTQKKIITYCASFKQFVQGRHLADIDERYLKREFLVEDFEKHVFQNEIHHIISNDVTFCSYEVLDSYLNLVTKNYIELQIGNSQFSRQRIFVVIIQDVKSEFLKGIGLEYDRILKSWSFKGDKKVIWKQKNSTNRGKQVLRLPNGRIFFTDGDMITNVASLEEPSRNSYQ